jgi:uncharacterized membrane protein
MVVMTDVPVHDSGRLRISRAQSAWLEAQSARWVAAGLLDSEARDRILATYDVESAEHRSMLALLLLGALMFGIGVLLLVGYNWAAIPAAGKIAVLVGSVIVAFGGAALAFARRHPLIGETVALVGVLLYGNAIWLIAQVLHIQGNYPDGFMWWAVGALATAVLVHSRIVGIGATIVMVAWTIAAGINEREPPFASFLILWPAAVAAAYLVHSPTMVRVGAAAAAIWVGFVAQRPDSPSVIVGLAALAACAFAAAGTWHAPSSRMALAWRSSGLAILLVAFVPLLSTAMHRHGMYDGRSLSVERHAMPLALLLLVVAVSPVLRWIGLLKREQASPPDPAAVMTVVTAFAVAVWLALIAAGYSGSDMWKLGATTAFSLLSLGLAVSLIRTALHTDRSSTLAFGVGFALAFLVVRWASLIDSMLWSGLMLLAASGGFFVIARLWRNRAGRSAIRSGQLS